MGLVLVQVSYRYIAHDREVQWKAQILEGMNGEKSMEMDGISPQNALIPSSLYACAQIDTCQVESYFVHLSPSLELRIKIIIHTLYFKEY
jgi:hypothetical protein